MARKALTCRCDIEEFRLIDYIRVNVINGKYAFGSAFGFGSKSSQTTSKTATITPNEKHTVKLLFSAMGKVSYFLDGQLLGTVNTMAGPIAHSTYPPTFGDRHGSNFQALGGGIASIGRLEKLLSRALNGGHGICWRAVRRDKENFRYSLTLEKKARLAAEGKLVL